jgi:predicted GNAT family acetyltransferase
MSSRAEVQSVTEPLTVQREQQGHRGAFYVEQDGARAAELTFSASPDGKLVMLDHTEVGTSLHGQGISRKLVEASVVWARQQEIKLVPVCPFARAIFENHPEFRDVLA